MTPEEYQNKMLSEFRKEADFINEFYGLGDEDHNTALNIGHWYELLKEYAQREVKEYVNATSANSEYSRELLIAFISKICPNDDQKDNEDYVDDFIKNHFLNTK